METCANCTKSFEKDEGKRNADGDFVCFMCFRQEDGKEEEEGVCAGCGEYSDEYRDGDACPYCGKENESEDEDGEDEDEEEEEKEEKEDDK